MLDVIAFTVAALSLLFAARCYLELHRWARQCQRARIVIGYKRKVHLQAPLVEWLGWANMLKQDEISRGRVIWRQGYATVAIQAPPLPKRERRRLRLPRVTRKRNQAPTAERQGRLKAV